jgi:Uma2 family endonuclease
MRVAVCGGAMAETRTLMTADELLHLPDDGKHYELVAGELIEAAWPGGEHGYVAGNASYRLSAFVEQRGLGGAVFAAATGFRTSRDPDTVRAPDMAYVAGPRVAQARVAGYPDLAPDLVVEVVSPNDRASEIHAKVMEWLGAGSQLVWVLYPASRTVVAHRPASEARVLQADDRLDGAPVLPGFSCRVGDLFA